MNLWTRVGVDEPRSRVEGGEPILCDYGSPSVVERALLCWALVGKEKELKLFEGSQYKSHDLTQFN
jgi:hypothetical protein